jgi:Holliday junction resolvase RusA-like endonuclease
MTDIIANGKRVAVVKKRPAFGLDHDKGAAKTSLSFTVPVPPSTNNLFNTAGHRRVRTAQYNAWIEQAGLVLNRQKPGRVEGSFVVSVALPAAIRGDIDNRYKALGDLMVTHGITEDDAKLRKLIIERCEDATDARVCVSTWGQG